MKIIGHLRALINRLGLKSYCGRNTCVYGKIMIHGKISIRNNCYIYNAKNSHLHIGNNTFINNNAYIVSHKNIVINDNVIIGPNVVIVDHNHKIIKSFERNNIFDCDDVCIQNNVWIGANCVILPGVSVGENSVIGACSVVTKNVPPNEVWCSCKKNTRCSLINFNKYNVKVEYDIFFN